MKRHLCNFGEKSFVFEAITDVDGPTLVNLKKLEMSAVVLKNDPSMTWTVSRVAALLDVITPPRAPPPPAVDIS